MSKNWEIEKLLSELIRGIVFLPLHFGNIDRIEKVKKIWCGKNFENIKNRRCNVKF